MLASLAVREGHWERRQARPIANLASKLRDCKSGDGPCRGAKKPGHAPELGLRPGATATAKWHRMYKSGALPDFLVEAWEAVQTMPNGSTFAGPSRGRFRGGGRAECGVPSSSPHFSKNRHPPRQHGPRGQPRRSTSGAWSTGWWTTTGASGAPSTKASGRPTHQRSTPPPRSALAASIQPAFAPPSALFANQVTPHAIAPGSAARERRHAKQIDILQQCLDLARK